MPGARHAGRGGADCGAAGVPPVAAGSLALPTGVLQRLKEEFSCLESVRCDLISTANPDTKPQVGFSHRRRCYQTLLPPNSCWFVAEFPDERPTNYTRRRPSACARPVYALLQMMSVQSGMGEGGTTFRAQTCINTRAHWAPASPPPCHWSRGLFRTYLFLPPSRGRRPVCPEVVGRRIECLSSHTGGLEEIWGGGQTTAKILLPSCPHHSCIGLLLPTCVACGRPRVAASRAGARVPACGCAWPWGWSKS